MQPAREAGSHGHRLDLAGPASRNGQVAGQRLRATPALGLGLVLLGAGLGLYLSRLIVEAADLRWTGPVLLIWVAGWPLAGAAVALAAGRPLLRRAGVVPLLPLGLLWAYVLVPTPDVGLAASLGLAAAAAALLAAAGPRASGHTASASPVGRPWLEIAGACAAGLAALALYLRTLAPTVQPADSGELQLVAATLGVAHPPGYPLYTLIGRLFTLLPLGDPAFRVNLLSAVAAAAAVGVVFLVAAALAPRRPWSLAAGLLAAGTLAVSATWWSQATVAAVRTLAGLFVALLLLCFVGWYRSRRERWLRALALIAGLSLTHHAPVGVLLPPLALAVLAAEPGRLLRPRANLALLALALLPLLVYLYIPLRAAAGTALEPPRAMSLDDVVAHVTARGFRGDMLHYGLAELPVRLRALDELVRAQFGALGVAVAAAGALALLWRDRVVGGLLALGWLANTALAITYRAPVITDYLIPSYLIMALWIGLAPIVLPGLVWRRAGEASRLVPALAWSALIVLLPLGLGSRNFPGLDASQDFALRRFADGLLATAAPGATVLADWHHATPLWYAQHVEGQRPDLAIRYVPPRGPSIPWVEEAESALARGRVYVSSFVPELAGRFQLAPAGPGLEVRREPGPAGGRPPSTPLDASFDGLIALRGYDLASTAAPAGATLPLTLHWQALRDPGRALTVFVHLVDADGRPVGQRDNPPVRGTYPTDRWRAGETVLDPYEVAILPTVPPGRYWLRAGLYETVPGGWRRLPVQGASAAPSGDAALLAEVEVQPAAPAVPTTAHRAATRFADGSELAAWAWDRPPEGPPVLRLWWTARPGPAELTLRLLDRSGRLVGARGDPLFPGQLVSDHPLPEGRGDVVELSLTTPTGDPAAVLGRWLQPAARSLRLPAPASTDGPAPLDLGHLAWFVGGEPERSRARPGEVVAVTTRWEAVGRLADDYRVFVHLRGPDGRAWAGDDGVPVEGILPTLRWPPGHVVTDIRRLRLPADLPPGHYELIAGLYPAWTGLRLPVLDERRARAGQGDYVVVGRLVVESP